jgi:hypothetical protein
MTDAGYRPLRVVQWATGYVGALCLEELIKNPDFELVGVLVYGDKAGKDAGAIVGLEDTGVIATRDREAIMAADADCVVYSPLASNMEQLDDDIVELLESGKNVVTTAGYFAPQCRGDELVARLTAACAKGGTSLLGTGIEPGFMLDRLGPMLACVCTDVDYIHLQEIADAAHHPAAEMMKEAIGFGKKPEQVQNDPVFGPYWKTFFTESVTSVAQGLGIELDDIQIGLEVAAAPRGLDIEVGHIAEGTVVGVRHTVNGIVDGFPFIRCEHVWSVGKSANCWPEGWPQPEGRYRYTYEIAGRPSLRATVDPLSNLTGEPGPDAGLVGTAAAATNAIEDVCAAAPGVLHPTLFAPWRKRGMRRNRASD